MNVILIAVIVLGVLGLVLAGALYVMSKKFAVEEDPRIGQVAEVLPGANCGGCGFPGCGGMAAACVKAADAGSLEGLNCPVGGQPTMEAIAGILGMEVGAATPKLAVVRCNGTCENRPKSVIYDGVKSCRIANTTCMGETACAYGCLGCGDCVAACQFGAITMNPTTGIPEVDATKCTACGACAKACPRSIIEIRAVNGDNKDAFVVECMNKDKGAQAMKACAVSCIACKKCENACGSDAVHVEGNLAYINPEACTLCGQCFDACPRGTIVSLSVKGIERKNVEKKAAVPKPAGASSTANVANAAPAKPAKEWAPIDIKFDASLLPSQQILLAGPKDISNPAPAAKESEFEAKRTDAPLPPSQMILLGLK
ncbi:MAG: RnfABCDGE type electron transport complex subunit B [Bacteroidaceae bacterium]|jgi:Na+-translocating ferredoxin:NAD+ oxidoreductase RNF subunit RnfB|nr:RnfABCDGE type electron transport complex subunit B [Bacteroidaceae bacterium]